MIEGRSQEEIPQLSVEEISTPNVKSIQNATVVEPENNTQDETKDYENAPTPQSMPETNTVVILQNAQIAGHDELQTPNQTTHIPSKWALKPPLAHNRLQGLGFSNQDIECLRALSEDCNELRAEVFAEYKLTETELVWTPDRPWTGMPAKFHGMTHTEIMEELGMNYAGGNAFMIVPGISIDGPLWDRLHGVNKPCRYVPAFSRDNGTRGESSTQGQLTTRRICD